MKDEKKLAPEELLIVELDDRYEFSGDPIALVNDGCINSNDCSVSGNTQCSNDCSPANRVCTNAGSCFA